MTPPKHRPSQTTFDVLISDHAADNLRRGRCNVIGAFIGNPEQFDAKRAIRATLTLTIPQKRDRRK